ncbi:MAG: tetratricopeptide repeat protein, partial [Gammaproteobacteria bacterium]
NLGNALASLARLEEAVTCYDKALKIDPGDAEALFRLGNVLMHLGRQEAAVSSYRRAIAIKQDYAEAHYNLGNALGSIGKLEEAVTSYERALEINPDDVQALNNLGNVLQELQKPEEGLASYEKALEIDPNCAEAQNNRGNALRNLGKLEEAAASYEKALEINPGYAEAHMNLSTVKEYQEGDPHVRQLNQLFERRDLSDEERMHLNFALGKAYADIGNCDRAFSRLADGNRIRKEQLGYDISLERELFARIESTFSKDLPVLDAGSESASTRGQRSIFVLGMPRSGTSLVEQILASHSRVCGAGELDLLNRSVSAIKWRSTELSPDQFHSVRESYVSNLEKLEISEPYIIDKMPLNFRWIGLICAAMPEAKIVHVKRDARATCWSSFKHYFSANAIGFACDLRDVAMYYRMYVDLMAFWHERFPGRIFDLNYEALTEDQEVETRKLLEYVGLEWEDQCLEFHKTRRAVQTASSSQVRQKMYQGSSEEWRKYEKHLGPMLELLRDIWSFPERGLVTHGHEAPVPQDG